MSSNVNRLPAPSSSTASSALPNSTVPRFGHTSGNLSVASSEYPPIYTLNISSMEDIQAIVGKARQQYPNANLTEQTIFNALTSYIERKKIHKHDALDNLLVQWATNISSRQALPELPPHLLNNNTKRQYNALIAEIAEIAQAAKRQRT